MPSPLRVVAAVITDGDKVLAFRRGPHVRDGGLWEFPGGKVEAGESPEEALRRELREELGVDSAIGQRVTRDSTRIGDRVIDLDCYWVTLDSVPASSTDHDAIDWVPIERAHDLNWAMPDLPAVDRLRGGARPTRR